jgi:hypothetical protein
LAKYLAQHLLVAITVLISSNSKAIEGLEGITLLSTDGKTKLKLTEINDLFPQGTPLYMAEPKFELRSDS